MQFRDVLWPFSGKLDESIHPKLYEQGFTVLENGVFTDQGAIEKRLGLTPVVSGLVPPSAHRLIPYDNQLLLTDNGYTLRANRDQGDATVDMDLISEATVKRFVVRREIDQSITYCDMATAGQHVVYAWINTDDGDCYYRLEEMATGTIVAIGVANSAAAVVATVRLASNGTSVLLAYADLTSNDLYARRIDCSTALPTVGSETALLSTLHNDGVWDICPMTAGTAGWALFFKDTTPVGVIREVNSANPPTLGWTATLAVNVGHVSCSVVGTSLFCAFLDVTNMNVVYLARSTSNGASVLASTTLEAAPAGNVGPTSIAGYTASAAVISWKSHDELIRWRTGSDAGALGGSHAQFRVLPESKTFYVAQTDEVYQWIRTNLNSLERGIFVLVHLNRTPATVNMRPVASFDFGLAPIIVRTHLANVAAPFDTERRAALLVLAAPGTAHQAIDECRATWGDQTRHLHQRYGGAVYIGGGILQQWDGVQLVENAYLQAPWIISAAASAGGSFLAGTYGVRCVFEEFDDNGEINRSLVDDHVTPIVLAANDKITFSVKPLTITTRQDDAQQLPRVEIALYVSGPDASAGPFYRIAAIGSATVNPYNGTADITGIVFNGPTPTGNPTLYTDGGVLENDAVYGGATILVEHKGRLWAAGGSDLEVYWYSQPRVDGEPANFNLAQTGRVAGHEITGLASMDDALIILTKTGVFRVHGEGPNATGDLSSGFFSDPVPIPSDTGCTRGPASVVTTPMGVMFGGRMGIYLIDRAYSVTYISGPVEDTLTNNADAIRRAVLDPSGSSVRFVLEDT